MMLGLGNSEISFDIVQSKCSNLGNQFQEISSNSPQGLFLDNWSKLTSCRPKIYFGIQEANLL